MKTEKGIMSVSGGDRLSPQALLAMFFLALQFGVQPILSKRYTPPSVCRSSVILVQEGVKFILASIMLFATGEYKSAVSGWSLASWISVAGIPAALYSVQNLAALLAYQHIDALTFCVLNQTKILSAALCCYIVIGRRQSKAQLFSLFLLLASALVIEKVISLDTFSKRTESVQDDLSIFQIVYKVFTSTDDNNDSNHSRRLTHGVIPVLFASLLSGLAGAISQKSLQGGGRNSYFFTMELCIASTVFLTTTLYSSNDGKLIAQHGFFHNWEIQTFIPVFVNAAGGIIVGVVTKYAGSVRKGFALIFGLLLSGVLQAGSDGVSTEQVLGGILASFSLWMHITNPYISTDVTVSSCTRTTKVSSTVQITPKKTRKARKED